MLKVGRYQPQKIQSSHLNRAINSKKKKNNVNSFHGNEWMKEHNYALQNAETRPRLQSRAQNICHVISISAVRLKLIVKITSIFGSYRFSWKNSMTWHFLTFTLLSSKLEFVYPRPCCGVEEQMLIFWASLRPERVKGSWNPIPKLTIVLIWMTPARLKFGNTSNRAVKNLLQRKLWVRAANDARSHPQDFLVF